MSEFTKHTIDTAPEASREAMEAVKEKFGFVPNLIAHLADAPSSLKAYVTLDGLVSKTSLTPEEREVVRLSVSVENGCHYCVPAHTAGAFQAGLDEDVVSALRDGREISGNPKLAALSRFVRAVVQERGRVAEEEVEALLDAGFNRSQVLEILVGVTQKTLSNYANGILGTEVDEPLKQFAWSGTSAAAASGGIDAR